MDESQRNAILGSTNEIVNEQIERAKKSARLQAEKNKEAKEKKVNPLLGQPSEPKVRGGVITWAILDT